MSASVPLVYKSSVSSYPSNGLQASRDTVGAPQLRSVPNVAQSQALRRAAPTCPTTPTMSARKTPTGTPTTSQPAMRISSNASTGLKYYSTPSVSTGTAMNRTSAATANVLSGGVNLGALSSKTLPATNPSGSAAPSTPVLRTVIPPRMDRFVANAAQAKPSQVAQQTPTDKADQSAQRNDKAFKPPEIDLAMGDNAKMMLAIPPPVPAPVQLAATSQVQAPSVVKKLGAATLSKGLKSGDVPKIADEMEAALNADEEAPDPSDAGRTAKLAQGLRDATDNGVDSPESPEDALRQTQIQKALMEAASRGLLQAPSELKNADEKAPVETQQVDAGPVPISPASITSPRDSTMVHLYSQPKSLRQKSGTRQLLGKLFGRTLNCFDDSAMGA